jgi:hypothetical protein
MRENEQKQQLFIQMINYVWGILIFKGLNTRRFYTSFGVKGLMEYCLQATNKGF